MKRGNDILHELQQIAPLAQWPENLPFTAPEGYFEHLPEIISDRLRMYDALNISSINPYTAPDGYFQSLPAIILQRIHHENESSVEEELEELSPFLAAMPRKSPFSVPTDYFNQLDFINHNDEQVTPRPTPVIPINRPAKRNNWKKWAAAACLAAIVSTSALHFLNGAHHHDTSYFEQELANISDEAIVSYLQNHADPLDNESIFAQVAQSGQLNKMDDAAQTGEQSPTSALDKYLQEADLSNELPNK
ncbi:hypothetical protein [Chitinophaga sp. Cy-1792]|uniref:hypothetical protein n=1 Tax=Chitinophaga sp. Cy-1792 TaxID=2608339 RepID=UPI00141EE2C2|nr:hypothetical protein [Chitinophaga sp. Cy-1792]NIG52914.1 hypothetical protein [Chitinophaga sp. Cy-1792]